MLRGAGWVASGLGPPRLDRPELLRRLAPALSTPPDASAWVIDELADLFEAAAHAAMAEKAEARRPPAPRKDPRMSDRHER
jgi:hypothetical protein